MVKYIADEIMVMSEGRVVEIANSDEIYRNPREPYTQRLLASIPKGWQGGAPAFPRRSSERERQLLQQRAGQPHRSQLALAVGAALQRSSVSRVSASRFSPSIR